MNRRRFFGGLLCAPVVVLAPEAEAVSDAAVVRTLRHWIKGSRILLDDAAGREAFYKAMVTNGILTGPQCRAAYVRENCGGIQISSHCSLRDGHDGGHKDFVGDWKL